MKKNYFFVKMLECFSINFFVTNFFLYADPLIQHTSHHPFKTGPKLRGGGPSVLVRFLWIMGSVLNRMRTIIKKLSVFYFSSYREKFIKNWGDDVTK